MRKKDRVIIGLVLLAALVFYGAQRLTREGRTLGGMVDIYADGVLYTSVPLDTPQAVRVEQPNGHVNIVSVTENGVHMEYSSCKNQLCVQQGKMSEENWTRRALGRTIVCLPNSVLVELTLSADHPTMQVDDDYVDI